MRFLHPSTQRFMGFFFRAYAGRTALMIALLIGAGLAEGVGLVTLLPLLELGTVGQEGGSRLTRAIGDSLGTIGLSPSLGVLLVIIVLMMITKAVFVRLAMQQVGYTVAQVATDLRMRLIRALLKARWRFFVDQPSGYFANAISTEAKRASSGYQLACQGMAGLVQSVIYVVVVFLVSWQVAVVALLVAPLVLYCLKGFVTIARRAGESQTTLMKQLIARVTEVLPGMKAIKAMGREAMVFPLLENETEEFNSAQKQAVLAAESLKAFQEPAIVVVLAVGLYATMTLGNTPTTSVLVAAALFYRVMTTASKLQTQYQQVTDKESAFWSLLETVESAEAAAEPSAEGKRAAPPLEDAIELDGVWFSYGEALILRDVNLRIEAGEVVTLVGSSGAGKTTLADLLAGLLVPDRGVIKVDGIPLSDVDRAQWRAQVGYVPQEVLLFHDTIFRNVTLGDPDLTDEDVRRALRASGAWQFVSEHPDGMQRIVGERGGQLSGGQRQRIGLARALVSRPRLLVLDEATTALDPETEAEVCVSIGALRGKTTVVAISHQSAIQAVSDRVCQVQEGVVEPTEPSAAMRGSRSTLP